jgi:hypothetical protein
MVLLAAAWVIFPEQNLEPVIVLLAAFIGIFPLIKNELIPWSESLRLKRKKFSHLNGSSNINGIEPSFDELFQVGGVQLNLVSQGFNQYPVKLSVFFDQIDFRFIAEFNNGKSIELKKRFNIGYELDEVSLPLKSNHYVVAQFDIDGDGIDEFILGVIVENSGLKDVQLTIYKFHPPLFEEDLSRAKNLACLGTVEAIGIVGTVNIELKKGAITIPRHHRGFYYKWAFVDGRFIDAGDY